MNVSEKWCNAGSTHVWLQQDNTITPCCALKNPLDKINPDAVKYKFNLDNNTNFLKTMHLPEWQDAISPLKTGQLPNGQWVGSLSSFSPGAGYWFNTTAEMCFNYTCAE